MASITIRHVDEQTVSRLRQRAAAYTRSIREAVRLILNDALEEIEVPAAGLGSAIRRRFAPMGGVNLCREPREAVGSSPFSDEEAASRPYGPNALSTFWLMPPEALLCFVSHDDSRRGQHNSVDI